MSAGDSFAAVISATAATTKSSMRCGLRALSLSNISRTRKTAMSSPRTQLSCLSIRLSPHHTSKLPTRKSQSTPTFQILCHVIIARGTVTARLTVTATQPVRGAAKKVTRTQTVKNLPHCTNCGGDHPAYSRECLEWVKQKDITATKFQRNIFFREARQIVEQRTAGGGGSSNVLSGSRAGKPSLR